MKILVISMMMIFSFSIFAIEQNPISDDFYFGAEHVEKCTALQAMADGGFDLSSCVALMSKVRITKRPILYNKIAIECYHNGSQEGPKGCLRKWDGVLLPEESETKCVNLRASECRDLYANSLKKFPIDPDKILMAKLKNAVDVGNLDLARNLINTMQRKKEISVACENPSNPGLEVSDTRLPKLNDDVIKALEKNKSVLGK